MTGDILYCCAIGEPISKANAVVARWNFKLRKTEVYIPERFLVYEEFVKNTAVVAAQLGNYKPYDSGPLEIHLIYYLSTKRIKDLLNLPKTTCDALQGPFYRNDCLIVEATLSKRYDRKNPRVEIWVGRPDNWEEKVKQGHWCLADLSEEKVLKVKKKVIRVPKKVKVVKVKKEKDTTVSKPAKKNTKSRNVKKKVPKTASGPIIKDTLRPSDVSKPVRKSRVSSKSPDTV